jgi:hypothetical protein
MAKIFLPPLDSRWRLVHDWTPSEAFFADFDNKETLWGTEKYGDYNRFTEETGISTDGDAGGPDGWVAKMQLWEKQKRIERGFYGTIPAGTIIQIERYHVSRSGENQITIKVLLSPSKFLTPKKQKGVMRGAGRLYFRLDDFNTLPELEEFTDVLS